ncbi:MAG: hypothetical protein JNJ58_09085 [Chitinophagaceae bacterium]|nr:hypothetical protein [Chitinophagaceae bacterium]
METSNNLPEPRKGMNPNIIYISIIAILAAVSIYLYVTKSKSDDKNEALTNQVETVSNDKAGLETEYNAALARLDEMKNQSVQMDSLLSTKSEEVEALKTKIKAILSDKNASAAQLKEANRLIGELRSRVDSYQQQITALKQENVQLTEDKRQLTETNQAITEEKENLKEDKKQLEKTVEEGSVLHASKFRMEAINQKKNLLGQDKEKGTEKARKTDLMRISFDLDDNRISESGDKVIYICVTDPSGRISSSGAKFTMPDGSQKNYTTTKTVPYRKGEKVYGVTTDWKPAGNFEQGRYKVELYHMGYKIGNEYVTLK